MNYSPVIILFVVMLLIAVRRVGNVRLGIWLVMLIGALAVVVTNGISVQKALGAINLEVLIFLFGMFIVGESLVHSGYLYKASFNIFKRVRGVDGLVLHMLFVLGAASAVLMNDTVAIIGTPLALYFAERHGVSSRLLLLTVCFAITTGSVLSPIGNPQNLLIATHEGFGGTEPFGLFLKYLALPTIVNMFIAFFALKLFFRRDFHGAPLTAPEELTINKGLAALSKASMIIVVLLILIKAILPFAAPGLDFSLVYIAIGGAAPLLFFSEHRLTLLKSIDWRTLIFFAALFVLMQSVWDSGVMQEVMARLSVDTGGGTGSTFFILAMSVIGSQILSNVPFVALYLPAASGADAAGYAALAAGSTIAGNLFILGAASNVIVVQRAEQRGASLGFLDFAKVGVPLTAAQLLVHWGYFALVNRLWG
ncbi:MAG: anion transporter [Deltaproteobacteria bacterium]|nr:anion transporter [Deltaproteobacteria bacterium]